MLIVLSAAFRAMDRADGRVQMVIVIAGVQGLEEALILDGGGRRYE